MGNVIYTRTGDEGNTSLACGSRLPKDDLRIEAYGTLDELSSILGVVSALLRDLAKADPDQWQHLDAFIEWMQDKLFTLSSMLATANLPSSNLPQITNEDVVFLESHIDEMEKELPELKNFILPGGSEVVSFIHLARTICRRAERNCTTLDREQKLHPVVLPFLNRLSDDLFVLARWVGYHLGETEKIWIGRKHPQRRQGVVERTKLVEQMLNATDGGEQMHLFKE